MRKSKLSQYKQSRLIDLFVAGTTVRTAAALVGVNKTTASYYFHRLRQIIYDKSEHLELLDGEIEADESYFVVDEKENEVEVLLEKCRCLAF